MRLGCRATWRQAAAMFVAPAMRWRLSAKFPVELRMLFPLVSHLYPGASLVRACRSRQGIWRSWLCRSVVCHQHCRSAGAARARRVDADRVAVEPVAFYLWDLQAADRCATPAGRHSHRPPASGISEHTLHSGGEPGRGRGPQKPQLRHHQHDRDDELDERQDQTQAREPECRKRYGRTPEDHIAMAA